MNTRKIPADANLALCIDGWYCCQPACKRCPYYKEDEDSEQCTFIDVIQEQREEEQ